MHWDDKFNLTLVGTLTIRRLSVSLSKNKHKVLGVPSLGNKLRNIYGKRVCEEVMNLLKNLLKNLCEQHLRYGF